MTEFVALTNKLHDFFRQHKGRRATFADACVPDDDNPGDAMQFAVFVFESTFDADPVIRIGDSQRCAFGPVECAGIGFVIGHGLVADTRWNRNAAYFKCLAGEHAREAVVDGLDFNRIGGSDDNGGHPIASSLMSAKMPKPMWATMA